MDNLQIHIITGLSGSGKSTAIAAFEDAGFFCVDNMPVALLPKFLELPAEYASGIVGLAFVMDLREKDFLSKYPAIFKNLRQKGHNLSILFLEADEDILLRRYSHTKRYHPLSKNKSLVEGIRLERNQLQDLRKIADNIINTSERNVHELKSTILKFAQQSIETTLMHINILSFGFKHGTPRDADVMIDVRFLTNPYFVQELKPLDGETEAVKKFVLNNDNAQLFLEKYLNLLDYLIPLYKKEGKAYLTIAVGCTGGRHRSVAIARELYEHLNKSEQPVVLTHRDVGR